MKFTLISVGALALLSIASHSAHAYLVSPTILTLPGYVQATVCNNFSAYPVTCAITSSGLLDTDVWTSETTAWPVYPGACSESFVYATPPFYFISGSGIANCY